MAKYYLLLILLIVNFSGCNREYTLTKRRKLTIHLYVKYDNKIVKNIPVSLKTNNSNIPILIESTDSTGLVVFKNLPFAKYHANVRGNVIIPSFLEPDELDTIIVVGSSIIEQKNKDIYQDTIYTKTLGTSPGLKINEIFFSGSPNNFGYQGDQFIELYNSSKDTIYLDGMMICRLYFDLDNVRMAFQFPGEPFGVTKEFPIAPGEFKVIAQDALNHRQKIFQGKVGTDLTMADFEFKNNNDFDNLNVPNLDNVIIGKNTDFVLSGKYGIVLITDGSDLNYKDGIEIESIIDCIQYFTGNDLPTKIDATLDRGYGGIGVSLFSGKSIERIAPGFDTNNSTKDFESLRKPTPGYQNNINNN